MENEKSTLIHVEVPDSVRKKIKMEAVRSDITIKELFNTILIDYLTKKEEQK